MSEVVVKSLTPLSQGQISTADEEDYKRHDLYLRPSADKLHNISAS
jgi:hypothetical protein